MKKIVFLIFSFFIFVFSEQNENNIPLPDTLSVPLNASGNNFIGGLYGAKDYLILNKNNFIPFSNNGIIFEYAYYLRPNLVQFYKRDYYRYTENLYEPYKGSYPFFGVSEFTNDTFYYYDNVIYKIVATDYSNGENGYNCEFGSVCKMFFDYIGDDGKTYSIYETEYPYSAYAQSFIYYKSESCEESEYFDLFTSKCSTCPVDTYFDIQSKRCVPLCKEGYYLKDKGVCVTDCLKISDFDDRMQCYCDKENVGEFVGFVDLISPYPCHSLDIDCISKNPDAKSKFTDDLYYNNVSCIAICKKNNLITNLDFKITPFFKISDYKKNFDLCTVGKENSSKLNNYNDFNNFTDSIEIDLSSLNFDDIETPVNIKQENPSLNNKDEVVNQGVGSPAKDDNSVYDYCKSHPEICNPDDYKKEDNILNDNQSGSSGDIGLNGGNSQQTFTETNNQNNNNNLSNSDTNNTKPNNNNNNSSVIGGNIGNNKDTDDKGDDDCSDGKCELYGNIVIESNDNTDYMGELGKLTDGGSLTGQINDAIEFFKKGYVPSIQNFPAPKSCVLQREFSGTKISPVKVDVDFCKVLSPLRDPFYMLFYISFVISFLIAGFKLLVVLFIGVK